MSQSRGWASCGGMEEQVAACLTSALRFAEHSNYEEMNFSLISCKCRAAKASNIAHKAAIYKSEAILRQAIEKAEYAREEATAAERQAAESAAHATAQQEVSASQAEVAEQVSLMFVECAAMVGKVWGGEIIPLWLAGCFIKIVPLSLDPCVKELFVFSIYQHKFCCSRLTETACERLCSWECFLCYDKRNAVTSFTANAESSPWNCRPLRVLKTGTPRKVNTRTGSQRRGKKPRCWEWRAATLFTLSRPGVRKLGTSFCNGCLPSLSGLNPCGLGLPWFAQGFGRRFRLLSSRSCIDTCPAQQVCARWESAKIIHRGWSCTAMSRRRECLMPPNVGCFSQAAYKIPCGCGETYDNVPFSRGLVMAWNSSRRYSKARFMAFPLHLEGATTSH